MNLLVTGAAGFIGSNLVHYLLEKATAELGMPVDRVVSLDLLTYAGNRASLASAERDPRHHFVQGDIGDPTCVGQVLREHAIDAVMHLAAESHVDRSIDDPEAFVTTNVVGTYRLLEAFRQYRADCAATGPGAAAAKDKVFLHVSTDEVFGSLGPADPPFHEGTPYSPNSPYSASKAASDHLARAYHHTYGVPVVITNCSNNYGPYQFPEKLLPLMIRKALRNEPLPIYGNGSNIRDWLYVEDHCRGLAMAVCRGQAGRTYVIGGQCELSNLEVVRALIATMRELAPGRITLGDDAMISFVTDRPGHDQRYAINPARIREELGWQPRESFSSGLRRTVQWYLDHDDWVREIENGSYRGQRLGEAKT